MFRYSVLFSALFAVTVYALPEVCVTSDDVRVTRSCRIVIPKGVVIEDVNGDGVIQIAASDIEVEFAEGAVLKGSPERRRPDEYKGYGIRLNGKSNVTIHGAQITGFWCGVWASSAKGLVLDGIDASDNRQAFLKSTPLAEDGGDWLYPHNNDDNEWLNNYGAAIYVEDSDGITVRDCKVKHGQNALCIDRVDDSKIYDNDFSFNSGWGIAMWRCNRNVITRNACDFCVRGYSHGVYNRGQDSAGILMFEQNSENIIAENSATHGGDCFFGFAGREALGEAGEHQPEWYKRRGNNNNLLINNDFSYAPAHGIEMTFSFGNIFYGNRMVKNAICGVWGGYSQDTLIAKNLFLGNGEMAYGLERGGVNIEHGRDNRIVGNEFEKNKCGVHLWWSPDVDFQKKPWGKANGTESKDNFIGENKFTDDVLAYHFRGASEVTIGRNTLLNVGKKIEKETDVLVKERPELAARTLKEPKYDVYGRTRPVGARKELYGRQNIIMTSWGPWDHQSPLVHIVQDNGDSVQYDMHKMSRGVTVTIEGDGLKGQLIQTPNDEGAFKYTVSSTKSGVHPYMMRIKAGDYEEEIHGTLVSALWDMTFFKWDKDVDPREHLEQWRELAQGETAVKAEAKNLVFPYGWGGPSDQKVSTEVTDAKLGGDYFGMIARTQLPLSAGVWEFATLSDDGVRVTVDGKPVIENWAWHGPTRDVGRLELKESKTVEIVVEHFEIDGYAVLELGISSVSQ